MNIQGLLLFPLALIYGIIMRLRNGLFKLKLIPSYRFPMPVICVGNLSTGGTGKTPHIEYLVRLLHEKYSVATLSRGYGRKTRGYIVASSESDYYQIGDEPLQYSRKFNDIVVAVDERRANGIRQLMADYPLLDIVLLDDGFQHRKVHPGLSILLTDYHDLYINDYLLPAGRLREPATGANRANIIIVTKTPRIFSPITRRHLFDELSPRPGQDVLFSYIDYDEPVPLTPTARKSCHAKHSHIFLLAGIANPYPLQDHLDRICDEVITLHFPDHHPYSEKDILTVRQTFLDHYSRNKIIYTTEKDAMRLRYANLLSLLDDVPIAYIPIKVVFHNGDAERFEKLVHTYVERDKRSRSIHTAEDTDTA